MLTGAISSPLHEWARIFISFSRSRAHELRTHRSRWPRWHGGVLLIFGLLIAKYYAPYPGVYRSASAVQSHIPVGLASTFVAILVLAAIYAKGYEGGSGLAEGARFGLLVGLFVVCAVVADEYVTLNIGRRLALAMAVGRLIEWIIVGMAIGW